jgi:hypothetical protein
MPATAAKPRRVAAKATFQYRGRPERVLTPEERAADMRAFGREIRQSKETAVAFLKSAGILDERGELAEPFRT